MLRFHLAFHMLLLNLSEYLQAGAAKEVTSCDQLTGREVNKKITFLNFEAFSISPISINYQERDCATITIFMSDLMSRSITNNP